MRELPRDLVTILRTEARNQRTPPIDYAIAEDGGRMVVYPEPDIAMAELLEEAATALAARDAELEKVKAECDKWREAFGEMHRQTMRAEAALAEAKKALEPFAKYASENGFGLNHKSEPLPDADGVGWVYLTNGDFRAARRALEAQGGGNG